MKIAFMIKIKTGPKKISRCVLLIVSLCWVLISCSKVSIDLGSDFVDNSTTNLVMVDTSTLEISTVYVDSFITSASGAILAGSYTDPQFGKIASNSFIQLGAPSGFSIPNGALFDSLEVILPLNKTFYGDTLTPYNIAIHQLNDEIKLPNDQYSFYNNDHLNYSATPLGSTRVIVQPGTRDSIAVRISAALGQLLFDKMFAKDEAVASDDQFIHFFKGLAIVDGGNNNLVLGFKDSITMRLHYRNPGVITSDAYIDFSINNTTTQFNNISVNRTATPIAALGTTGNKQLLSTKTQNAGYGQYISGAMMKIGFPHLRNLLQLNDFVKIIRADLILKPVKNSFLNFYTLPPYLRLSTTDQYNVPGTDLTTYSSSTSSSSTQYGNLYIDHLYGTETAYKYDVTAYLQEQIARTDINKNGLLLLPPNPVTIFDRVMIGDGKNAESRSEVRIYYATVK